MNWLDQAIGWLAPEAAARRMAFRRALEIQQRGYDAARRDHRTMSWNAPSSSSNAEVASSEETVRNRVRDLVRNNGWAQQIVETFADHVVGTGIVGAPVGLSRRNLQRALSAWRNWCDVCDHDGDQDLNGLIWSGVKGMAESGAALLRFHRVPFDARTNVAPLRLQLLEPDFIDTMKSGATSSGGIIDRGIEYDASGRKVAFWLMPAHPGDVASWRSRAMSSQRVPVDEVIYLYNKLRPGQDRGMPLLTPAVMPLNDLKGYFQAELVRKRIESCLAGFITSDDDVQVGTDSAVAEGSQAAYGRLVEKFEPGMMMRLRPGEDITITSPSNSQGVAEFAHLHLREVAAAGGVMYEHATGDFSNVNYSSWRAGHHGFRRRMERIQWNVAVFKACRPIGMRFQEAARAASLLPVQEFGWRWTPPGFISVDPNKDAQADLANLRMGKVTLSRLVEERGDDYAEHLAQYAADLQAVDDALGAGVMFDGDPRKAAAGQQSAASPADDDADGPQDPQED